MNYFKHSELAQQYHVSLKTVHNWITAAKDGKLDLKLHEAKSGTYVANSAENIHTLESLAEKGKKYRNSVHQKLIKPSQQFYEIFDQRQILDIINNIEVRREIPLQYAYADSGARKWDEWTKEQVATGADSMINATMSLLKTNTPAIDRLISNAHKVNIIDLGAGNAYPVKEFLAHLLEKGKLNRYIAIDISPAMLSIAQQNIHEWFGDEVKFEGHLRDFIFERFDDLVVEDVLEDQKELTINIIMMLGGTMTNFRAYDDAFRTIYSSMHKNDLLVYTDKPDSPASRRYINFRNAHNYILGYLNITEDLFEPEVGFDEEKLMRYVRIRFKTAVTLEFQFDDKPYLINIEKGELLTVQHIWHLGVQEIINEFDKAGLEMLQSSVTSDRQYLLSISGVNTKLKYR